MTVYVDDAGLQVTVRDDPALRSWRCKLTDGWWCVFDSTGALLAKFLHEGDCRTFMRLAGPPQPDHREAA